MTVALSLATLLKRTASLIDDYLNLLATDLSAYDTIVVTGPSGSGKSTHIDLLLKHHPQFVDVSWVLCRPADPGFSIAKVKNQLTSSSVEWLVVDEIYSMVDALMVRRLLRYAPKCLIASHVSPKFFKMMGKTLKHIDTSAPVKLKRYLTNKNISLNEQNISLYLETYGPVYTQLEIMLNACPSTNLAKRVICIEK